MRTSASLSGWTRRSKRAIRSPSSRPWRAGGEDRLRPGRTAAHLPLAEGGGGGLPPPRLWWALDYYGHPHCKVLNGGFQKWFAEGRPVTPAQPPVEPAPLPPRPRP